MSNLSYCRFRNTLADLQDCKRHVEDKISEDEHEARSKLLGLCHDLACINGQDLDYEGDDE